MCAWKRNYRREKSAHSESKISLLSYERMWTGRRMDYGHPGADSVHQGRKQRPAGASGLDTSWQTMCSGKSANRVTWVGEKEGDIYCTLEKISLGHERRYTKKRNTIQLQDDQSEAVTAI
ncbi:hypothetical protein P5V15_001520 [Pogonomyrmex californicus]